MTVGTTHSGFSAARNCLPNVPSPKQTGGLTSRINAQVCAHVHLQKPKSRKHAMRFTLGRGRDAGYLFCCITFYFSRLITGQRDAATHEITRRFSRTTNNNIVSPSPATCSNSHATPVQFSQTPLNTLTSRTETRKQFRRLVSLLPRTGF